MKKNNTRKGVGTKQATKPSAGCTKGAPQRSRAKQTQPPMITIGLDLGDKSSCYCALDQDGEVLFDGRLPTTRPGLERVFGALDRCRVALEVGTHSHWVSRLLAGLGHEVIVANARQVQLISKSSRKTDRVDAQTLARLARVDPQLLRPIRHRGEQAQLHLATVRVRCALLEARTQLVNAARGLAKSHGERLPACDADQMGPDKLVDLPVALSQALRPLLEQVAALTEKIQELDAEVARMAREHPACVLLQQVTGVGPLISLTYVLTVEDPQRFQRSRDVGCYVGLRPKRSDSGESQPELRITKEGDRYLRQLLVQGAHYILGHHGPDTDLRRWGLRLAARGGKNAKKRAVVAVARKLAVLLHRLWVSGAQYEPLRNSSAVQSKRQAVAAA